MEGGGKADQLNRILCRVYEGSLRFASVTVTLVYPAKQWRVDSESWAGTPTPTVPEAAELTAKNRFPLATCALRALHSGGVSILRSRKSDTGGVESLQGCRLFLCSCVLRRGHPVMYFRSLFRFVFSALSFALFRWPLPLRGAKSSSQLWAFSAASWAGVGA